MRALLLVFDIGTSILGAIWYGVADQPANSRIELSQLEFASAELGATVGAVAFVVLLTVSCVGFGKELTVLTPGLRRDPAQQASSGGPWR